MVVFCCCLGCWDFLTEKFCQTGDFHHKVWDGQTGSEVAEDRNMAVWFTWYTVAGMGFQLKLFGMYISSWKIACWIWIISKSSMNIGAIYRCPKKAYLVNRQTGGVSYPFCQIISCNDSYRSIKHPQHCFGDVWFPTACLPGWDKGINLRFCWGLLKLRLTQHRFSHGEWIEWILKNHHLARLLQMIHKKCKFQGSSCLISGACLGQFVSVRQTEIDMPDSQITNLK